MGPKAVASSPGATKKDAQTHMSDPGGGSNERLAKRSPCQGLLAREDIVLILRKQ